MKGDYNETDASQLGRWRVDWGIVAVVVGGLALGVFSFFASGCAIGAEPVTFAVVNRVPPKFEVVNRIPTAVKSAPSPPRLIGWNVPQPDGSVLFVPVQQPTPPGAMTIPAPGVAVPPPFAAGGGSWGAGPTTTDAPTAAPFNPGWSPAGRTFPVIPTDVRTRSVAPGVRTSDCPT